MTKISGFWFVLGLGTALAIGGIGCADSPPPAANSAANSATTVTTTSTGLPGDDDGDGIPNADDKCPGKKEDGLGALPKDGCPNAG